MIYGIISIIGVIAAVAAFVMRIINENKVLKDQNANAAVLRQMQERADKIAAAEGKVKEDVRDYDSKKAEFLKNNPPPASPDPSDRSS